MYTEGESQSLLPSTPGNEQEQNALSNNAPVHHRTVDDDIMPETATVGRNLSWSSAYILVISRVIGSGIFATPGSILKSSGSIGLTVSVWVVGAILAACGLAVSLELGCMLPRSGGDKVYLEYTYRYPRFLASTLIAIQAVLLGFSASNCIIFSKYTLFALDIHPSELQSKLVAASLLTVVTLIHGRFLKAGIYIQDVLGWIKIFLAVAVSLTGIWVIVIGHRHDHHVGPDSAYHESTLSWDEIWKDSNWSFGVLSTSLFKGKEISCRESIFNN